MAIPFIKEFDFQYGAPKTVTPNVRRIVAHNPNAFTFKGTGTYAIGHGNVAIVDPGPEMQDHVDAVLNAVRGETVTHILVTHTHVDHSPATAALKAATGATVYAFGPHPKPPEGVATEQGGDHGFTPDVTLRDGEVVNGKDWTVEAVHTPGHISNHLCFALREDNVLLSGDHVMGWSTAVISPPDGNMRSYFESLRKLLPRPESIYIPTHGAEIRDPRPFVQAYIDHRIERERQILGCLRDGLDTVPAMVGRMYKDVPAILHPAAGRSVLAHLIQFVADGRVQSDGPPTVASRFKAA
ncbi:MBL fold metallo-hydrolase [Vineibacter terrae]|uniref:MBL fold metallo-hydrolase n=1 Tax=Vineibacter terrae TaxID=2586908 RepID=A0A5C8PAZ0_9HYPH|nr:MBL fold metallo-hydrolase [Vineibacter terrae]TXL70971.1 MBL fold metallo-hydrolase [Vineibacter terrae]